MSTKKEVSGAAKVLSKRGASKGGQARAKKLSPSERSDIARRAAAARWAVPKSSYEGNLEIGDISISCYVLEDGTRVISHRGLQTALSMPITGGARETAGLVKRLEAKGLTVNDLVARMLEPIVFLPLRGGRTVYGYEASVLADLCDVILEARKVGILTSQQQRIALRCEILVRGFAKVGIIALVDEATGYQVVRARTALAEILETFIKHELGKWARRFPTDFYRELFRLKKLEWPFRKNPPQYVGHWTNDLVYTRLAPGVLDELSRRTPKDAKGRRKHRFHQWLTEDVGHPRLQEHLSAVIALMKAFDDWDEFKKALDRSLPKYKEMPLFDHLED